MCHCRVKNFTEFSKHSILKSVSEIPKLLVYLPDEPATHVTREFLIAIVNTIDPSYFKRAIMEIDVRKLDL